MAATQVIMTGKWALVGSTSQGPKMSAKAFLVGMVFGSVDLVRIGIPASISPSSRVQASSICRQNFPDDSRCFGGTWSPNPQLEPRR